MVVPAPGRFSTTTVLPSRSSSSLPSRRARKSVAAPGVNGTTKVSGRLGYSCAPASKMHAAHTAAASALNFKILIPHPNLLRTGETGVPDHRGPTPGLRFYIGFEFGKRAFANRNNAHRHKPL